MNITELARQFKITTEELKEILPLIGFDIGKKAIKVDDRLVERIKSAFYEFKKQQALEQVLLERQEKEKPKPVVKEKVVELGEVVSVGDLAQEMGIPVSRLIAEFIKNGVMASLSDRIDFETASIVSEDLGFKVIKKMEEEALLGLGIKEILEKSSLSSSNIVSRPPVVVVVGHVDHGKTTLLDAIRKTDVVAGEAGGITQHIGAYQVHTQSGRVVTFLDTPGHEAFKAMRVRGSKLADVAVVVVAADDGLKPQTLESIQAVQNEHLPFVIAINKIDKPGADIDKVKKELAEINLSSEDWGGKTICVPISAKQGIGIESLLEHILLLVDIEDLKAPVDQPALGTIIEAHIDKNQGPVATVLVHSGLLKKGDIVQAGHTFGRIKAMYTWDGEETQVAKPSMPVKILGLKLTPGVGDILESGKEFQELRKSKIKMPRHLSVTKSLKLEQLSDDEGEDVKTLKLIVCADVTGSLEALCQALESIKVEGVKVKVVSSNLGNVNESDISHAETVGAHILGFNADLTPGAKILSRSSTVKIFSSRIIYELIDSIKDLAESLRPKISGQLRIGRFKITHFFKKSGSHYIIGGLVEDGYLEAKTKFHLIRDGTAKALGDIDELQINKTVVAKIQSGTQAGLNISCSLLPQIGDLLEVYKIKED